MTLISKDSVTLLTLDDNDAGQRIDNFLLRHLKGVPKSHVYRILRSGEVRVNKGRIDASYRLQAGDIVRIPPVRVAERSQTGPIAPAQQFTVVFEDDTLLVINKPSGVAVHGGSGVSFGVIEQLRSARPESRFLELIHRLDRETSGLLMIAKKRSCLVKMHEVMRGPRIDKRYLALACGQWPAKLKDVTLPLHKYLLPDGERRVQVQSDGKAAHTRFRIMQPYADFTLVEAQLKTGRTHQIRVHMQSSGYPIAGDEKYGDFSLNKQLAKQGLKRMFLHAARLQLKHPLTDEPLVLEAPLPDDLSRFLTELQP